MPRLKRKRTITKVYHVILRGIDKQSIFLDEQDYIKFTKEVKRTKEKYKYEIYAYAIMNNHVHFIIYDENENISTSIQSLNVSYSSYFNKKYVRTGHLFENRFKSKIVETESYLKSLVRYIHKNPENAGMQPYYRTSYFEYISKPKIINREFVLNCFGEEFMKSLEYFKEFHKNYKKYDDYDKDYEFIKKISDEEAIKISKAILLEDNLMNILKYEQEKRDEAVLKILKIEGIRKEQIARITGLNRRTILNIENRNSHLGQITQKETSPMGKKVE